METTELTHTMRTIITARGRLTGRITFHSESKAMTDAEIREVLDNWCINPKTETVTIKTV